MPRVRTFESATGFKMMKSSMFKPSSEKFSMRWPIAAKASTVATKTSSVAAKTNSVAAEASTVAAKASTVPAKASSLESCAARASLATPNPFSVFALTTLIATAMAIATSTPARAAAQDAADKTPQPDIIVTTGEGTVRTAPDQAFVSITAESRARTPREAQKLNAQAMSAVQEKLKAAGFSGDAVRTLQLELQPQFDFVDGKQRLREYLARNSIEVRVEPVERVGEISDLAVGSGATSISNIRFELKDRLSAEKRALQEAVTQARGRADAIAQAGNRAIDRIIRIEDQRQEVPPPRPFMTMARAEAVQVETPVAPGVLEIKARVVLTAKMR